MDISVSAYVEHVWNGKNFEHSLSFSQKSVNARIFHQKVMAPHREKLVIAIMSSVQNFTNDCFTLELF